MRLCRISEGDHLSWGRSDPLNNTAQQLYGSLSAWAPLIACGGNRGLPLNGRILAADRHPLLPPVEAASQLYIRDDSDLVDGGFYAADLSEDVLEDDLAGGGPRRVALIVGTSLVGRSNPLRSLLGFSWAQCQSGVAGAAPRPSVRLSRWITTRDEMPSQLFAGPAALSPRQQPIANVLTRCDAEHKLKIGDGVILTAADSAAFTAELLAPRAEQRLH